MDLRLRVAMCFPDWSWVGHGSNIEVEPRGSDHPTVIVSRSHSGDVKEKATKAFGHNVKIEPAGGAGELITLDNEFFLSKVSKLI